MTLASGALRALFKEVEPDMEFGCFTVLYGPDEGQAQGRALVQVDMGECHSVGVCMTAWAGHRRTPGVL